MTDPSQFSGLWLQSQAIFDTVFGETFDFEPRIEVRNALSAPDPSRSAIVDVVGMPVSDGNDIIVGTHGLGRIEELTRISFQLTKFPQGIQRFDQLRRKWNGRLYEVESGTTPEAIYRILVRVKEIPG